MGETKTRRMANRSKFVTESPVNLHCQCAQIHNACITHRMWKRSVASKSPTISGISSFRGAMGAVEIIIWAISVWKNT